MAPKLKFKIKNLEINEVENLVSKRSTGFKPEDLDRPFYPSDDTINQLANITYKDAEQEADYIPSGWKRLLTGRNKKDGYFGAAFYHEENQQLVISHRGTDDLKDIDADIHGIALKRYSVSQVHTSCTFAFRAMAKVYETNTCSITITGHSLGGWLAQITAFAIEYLTLKGEEFASSDKTERKCHPHTVTFDSPGCYKMLCKLSADFLNLDKEKAGDLISKLDITTYFIAPNDVNSKLRHAGKLLCFKNYLESIGIDSDLKMKSRDPMYFHQLGHFRIAFQNDIEILNVIQWPKITSRKMVANKLGTVKHYIEYKATKWLNRASYMPSIIDGENTSGKSEVLKKVKTETYDKTALSINFFREQERIFLRDWKKAKEDNSYKSRIDQFFMEKNSGSFDDFLPDFEILNDKIKSTDAYKLTVVANRIKWLLVIFPDAFKITNEKL